MAKEERQTTESVAHVQWPSLSQKIPFHGVIDAFERLDAHLFLTAFDLPSIVSPHVAALCVNTWWDYISTCYALHICFDGSFASRPAEGEVPAGMAVAALVLTDAGWVFAGALDNALNLIKSSYTAELAGAIVAHKFAYDLLKLHFLHHRCVPEVEFFFDALTVGSQAAGDWSSIKHPIYGRCLRDLVLLIEKKFENKLKYQASQGMNWWTT